MGPSDAGSRLPLRPWVHLRANAGPGGNGWLFVLEIGLTPANVHFRPIADIQR